MIATDGTSVAHRFALEILEGRMGDEQIAARLLEIGRRGETAEELLGMTSAFYAQSTRVPTEHPVVMDLCGTGGAPVRTFNVSTVASFVLAAGGVPVAKHGNRSSRGRCGSADLLEAIGANIAPGAEMTARMLNTISFTFLFAPAFHPAMRHVAKARKLVADRTIFNLMGPLMNPVLAPRRQLMGVCDPHLLEIVPPVLEALGVDSAMVVHGEPGMDEVSVCGATEVAELRNGKVDRYEITPEELGLARCHVSKVDELSPHSSARLCYELLRGRGGERRDMLLMNSGCAFYAFGSATSIASGISKAERVLDSGKGFDKMREYIMASREGERAERR